MHEKNLENDNTLARCYIERRHFSAVGSTYFFTNLFLSSCRAIFAIYSLVPIQFSKPFDAVFLNRFRRDTYLMLSTFQLPHLKGSTRVLANF